MTVKLKITQVHKKQAAPKISSEMLARQTEQFLKSGGTIEVVKAGVSGQKNMPGRKDIIIDSRPKQDA